MSLRAIPAISSRFLFSFFCVIIIISNPLGKFKNINRYVT